MSSKANKFASHFDNNWITQKSKIRDIRTERVNYSPTYSWNAQSDDPRVFSKLNADQLPVQPTHPCTLSGARIIELEPSSGMEVLNGLQKPLGTTKLPLTPHQVDAGMIGDDLRGNIPIVSNANNNGQKVIMKHNYSFQNYTIRPPDFVAEELPTFYREAGPQGDQKLLTPAQRRKMMEIDAQSRSANAHLGQAVNERNKLKTSLTGPSHHRGVLMVDSSDNINSEIYGNKAQEILNKTSKVQQFHEARQQNLLRNNGSLSNDFGNLVTEDKRQEKLFQNKKYIGNTLSFEETFHRVFEKEQLKPPKPERTQHLRDQDLLGKNYNIITNTAIVYGKSSIEEKKDKILSHPSQQSLHCNRNLQGSLRPI
mmetsp:Transcript_8952/g.9469  ORF Transcript_8952/g.9469 Transcript_8952/m.9469 type:complete len:368 (+) Transcript_8952:58-1161(+)